MMSDDGQSLEKEMKDIKFEGEASESDKRTDSLKNQIKAAIGEDGKTEKLQPELNPHTPNIKPRGVRQNLFSFAINDVHAHLPIKKFQAQQVK
jgi:hypothetical protein